VNSALFVQDSWRLGRWTLNPGLRYERFVMSIPAQGAGAGTWVPARDFAAQDGLVNWNTVSPRLGFSWDMFGDGRTALKGGVSRYDRLEGVTIIQPLNQLNISFRTCPWSDTNSDKNAQNNEIAFASCSGSLQPALGNVDPGLKRPHQWEYTAMLQRQIGSVTSVSIGYYGRRFGDLYTTVNAAVPSTAYSPVTVTNPVTNQPMTVYNQDPATRGAVRNVLTTLPELAQQYNGVEFQVNTRLPRATVFGGLTIGRDSGDQDANDQPRTSASTTPGRSGSTRPTRSVAGSAPAVQTSSFPAHPRSHRPAPAAHLRRHDHDRARLDAGHAECSGCGARCVSLSVAEHRRPAHHEDVHLRHDEVRTDRGHLQPVQQRRRHQRRHDGRFVARTSVEHRHGPAPESGRADRVLDCREPQPRFVPWRRRFARPALASSATGGSSLLSRSNTEGVRQILPPITDEQRGREIAILPVDTPCRCSLQ
jgi:hypothetical protein